MDEMPRVYGFCLLIEKKKFFWKPSSFFSGIRTRMCHNLLTKLIVAFSLFFTLASDTSSYKGSQHILTFPITAKIYFLFFKSELLLCLVLPLLSEGFLHLKPVTSFIMCKREFGCTLQWLNCQTQRTVSSHHWLSMGPGQKSNNKHFSKLKRCAGIWQRNNYFSVATKQFVCKIFLTKQSPTNFQLLQANSPTWCWGEV